MSDPQLKGHLLDTSDLFKDVVFFVDPSVPKILAEQISTLLCKNCARPASSETPCLEQVLSSIGSNLNSKSGTTPRKSPAHSANVNSSRLSPSPSLIENLRPRFDLTTTTHLITSSLHLPEYKVLGSSDDDRGEALVFQYSPASESDAPLLLDHQQTHRLLKKCVHLVTPLWVTQSYDLDRILPPGAYSPDPYKFFSGVVIALDSEALIPPADVDIFHACVKAWGGQLRKGLTREVTHLICTKEDTKDYKVASRVKDQVGMKVVLPHWFHHSVFFRTIVSEAPFEFPSPSILKSLSLSEDPDIQHDINGLPGSRLPASIVMYDSEAEEMTYQTATELAFAGQKITPRSICPAFKGKSIYFASTLGLSLVARKSLARRVGQLGGRVVDAASITSDSDAPSSRVLSESVRLQHEVQAEAQLVDCDFVICECRAGWEFWLATDLDKVIGTVYWLLGILNTASNPDFAMRAPSERLLNFPFPPGPISGWGNDAKPVTITNYTGSVRNYLIKLLEKMHIKFSGTLDAQTGLVVAANKAGGKVAYATKRGIQIVNHFYIEDCFKSWNKQAIQPHHISFPDGVNLGESVGQQTHELMNLQKWSRREDVKARKSLEMAQLPSKRQKLQGSVAETSGYARSTPNLVSSHVLSCDASANGPSKAIRSPGPPCDEDSNCDGPIDDRLPVLRPQQEATLAAAGPSTLLKSGRRKPRLMSSSVELEDEVVQACAATSVAGAERASSANSSAPAEKSVNPGIPSKTSVNLISHGETVNQPSGGSSHKRTSRSPELSSSPIQVTKKKKTDNTRSELPPPEPTVTSDRESAIEIIVGDAEGNKKRRASGKTIIDRQATPGGKAISADKTSPSEKATPDDKTSSSEKATPDENLTLEEKTVTVGAPDKPNSLRDGMSTPPRDPTSAAALVNRGISTPGNRSRSPATCPRQDELDLASPEDSLEEAIPSTAVRSSTRKAAQRANQKVSSAVQDMNLHAKEKKRKRAWPVLPGLDEDGYAEDGGAPKSRSASKKQGPSNTKTCSSGLGSSRGGNDKSVTPRGAPRARDLQNLVSDDESRLDSIEPMSSKRSKPIAKSKKDSNEETAKGNGPKRRGAAVKHFEEDWPSTIKMGTTKSNAVEPESSIICILQAGDRIPDKLCSKLQKLGATFTETPKGFTHLITQKVARSEKFITAVVRGCHIVDHGWAEACAKMGGFVDEKHYMLRDPKGEKEHQFLLKDSLQRARSEKILAGKVFFVSAKVPPDLKTIKGLIELAGGKVVTKAPLLKDVKGRLNTYVVSCAEDSRFWKPLLKDFNNEDLVPIYTHHFVLEGLLIQKLDPSAKYQLKVDGNS